MDQNQRSQGFWLTEGFLSCHQQSCFQTRPVSKESIVVCRHYLIHPSFILLSRYCKAGSPSVIGEGTTNRGESRVLSPSPQHHALCIGPACLSDTPWFTGCISIKKQNSHPDGAVMLFGKLSWQASSFCRTRSPRPADLKKNHCVSLSIGKNFSLIK